MYMDAADGPLDPLLRGLVTFTSDKDLYANVLKLYLRMDLDESGTYLSIPLCVYLPFHLSTLSS